MPSFNLTLPIEASSQELWALISDVPRFAGLFPYITLEGLESPAPGHWLFQRRLTIPNIASLAWREENRITGEGELSFRALEGDLETFQGRWLVTANGKTELELELEYEIPPAISAQAPAGLAKYVMDELFKAVCRRVKETVEEDAG